MTVLTEAPRPGEAIISEADNYGSRDSITITESQTLLANQVIGKVVTAATVAAAAAVAGNTGNGAVTLAGTPFTGSVQEGTYRLNFTAPTKFNVFDPKGGLVGAGVVGTAFSNQLAFTVAAGGTAFAAGDGFTIAVSATTVRWGAYDPAATDGRAVPAGVIFDKVTTGAGTTAKATGFVRSLQLNGLKLQWLTGLNSTQKAAAIALLNASGAGITVRQ